MDFSARRIENELLLKNKYLGFVIKLFFSHNVEAKIMWIMHWFLSLQIYNNTYAFRYKFSYIFVFRISYCTY